MDLHSLFGYLLTFSQVLNTYAELSMSHPHQLGSD